MPEKTVKIGNREVRNFGKPFIIAEIGSNHNGKIELAKKLVDKAVECGADAVKFQSFDTELFSEACYETDARRTALMRESEALNRFFTTTHPQLKREMQEYAASKDMLREMKRYCDEKRIMFCCTPLDKGAVDFLTEELNVDFMKVASMDLNNFDFLAYIARKGRPIVLSTGMASFSEILDAVEIIQAEKSELILLHCVSTYPPKNENINLNNLDMLRNQFDFPIGWSDHTIGCVVSIAAVAKGACMIEKHFTLDKSLSGWDHKVSATPDELKYIVEESKKVWEALGSYKRVLPKEEIDKRALFRRSVVYNKNLPAGHVLGEEDIGLKRPGIGIEPRYVRFVTGRTLKKEVKADDLMNFRDFL